MVAETYEPGINGVTNSVRRSADHLVARGHQVHIVAPAPGPDHSVAGIEVTRVRSASIPGYPSLRVGVPPTTTVHEIIRQQRPDIIHLAAPTVLGHRFARAAKNLGVPTIAVFQTDLSGFVTNYGASVLVEPIWRHLRAIHDLTARTLVPSTATADLLIERAFEHVFLWGRGVDHGQFSPNFASRTWRSTVVDDEAELVVGYCGRLAREKQVERLREIESIPGVRLVVIGDGPMRRRLERQLPTAVFTGFLTGRSLGVALASLDVFVHTGPHETFCQTIQEAMASGVPVVAPAAGGPLDLVSTGTTGLLFPVGPRGAFREAVQRLVDHPELRMAMGRAGQMRVRDRTWSAIGDELIAHYEAIGNGRSTGVLAASATGTTPSDGPMRGR